MFVTDEDLFAIGEGVWMSIGLEGVEQASPEDAKFNGRVVCGFVQITGEAESVVSVRCSRTMAETIASSMFAIDANELSDEEIYDAIGEIANMIGGGVKGIASGENSLTIPVVAEGDENVATVPGTTIQNQVVTIVNTEPVLLRVCAREASEA